MVMAPGKAIPTIEPLPLLARTKEYLLETSTDVPLLLGQGDALLVNVAPSVGITLLHQPSAAQDVTISLGEGAAVKVFSLYPVPVRKEIFLASGARLEWIEVAVAGAIVESNTYLQGAGAEVVQRQLLIGKGTERPAFITTVVHEASKTNSFIQSKGIIGGQARGLCQGKIVIKADAAGCVGKEKADLLLLSPTAKGEAIPILDVANDDVQCSHGVSLGRMDEQQLFYLMARGVEEKDARQLVIHGFVHPVIKELPIQQQQIVEGYLWQQA